MIKGLSLFANVGIAETYLKEVGVDIVVANELLEERARFYKHLYPNCNMIQGDITNKEIFNYIIDLAMKNNIDFILATPPCQGMSTAGKMVKDDTRNRLIIQVVQAIKKLSPKYALIENVSAILKTKILVENKWMLISDYIYAELGCKYSFNENKVLNTEDYGVPQSRERCIYLLTRNDVKTKWNFPHKYNLKKTMRDVIGDLPSLDPYITDIPYGEMLIMFPEYEKKRLEGLSVSKWHYPPNHKKRHVLAMMHTPEGKSAWDNKIFYPTLSCGAKSKGYKNTYKRQWWDRPAYTVTKYTSRLGSQENGHPGRVINQSEAEEQRVWSDARVLTIFELMRITTLPDDWNIPEWASNNLIREVVGEGIPPELIRCLVKELDTNEEE